jgi:heat-inducible transcriptional repressor
MSTPEHTDARPALSDREETILQMVVQNFVSTAGPVGSRTLAKEHEQEIGLSAASIRNTMSDLEDMGYLDQPHTSAGRVPTGMGYRTFVDELMSVPSLSPDERHMLHLKIREIVGDLRELMSESSRLLGRLSSLLGVALSPPLSTGTLDRLEIVPLTGGRVMFVLSIEGGLAKTIVLELEASDMQRRDIDRITRLLNERLAGLTLREIRDTHVERVRDLQDETGIVRLVVERSDSLFSEPAAGRLRFGPAQHIMAQPEFQETGDLRSFMELMEDEDFVVHLLEDQAAETEHAASPQDQVNVRIGSENSDEKAQEYSIVTAPYALGKTSGTVGVIGPTRMEYGHVVALVQSTASMLSSASSSDDATA